MSAAEPARTRVLTEEEILKIVPTLPYRTSWELYWPGVEVHRYRLPAGSSGEHSFPRLAIFLSQSPEVYSLEVTGGGMTIRKEIRNNSVTICPRGLVHHGKRNQPGELTAIFLDLSIV